MPYVQRDVHARVGDLVARSGFVVLRGDSGSGKSRLAFEVLQQVRPDDLLFAPEPAALESAIGEVMARSTAVLWLDELERFLTNGALTASAIDRLRSGGRHRRLIVATIRSQVWAELSTTNTETAAVRTVFDLAEVVTVERQWSAAEMDKARREHDARVADAVAHAQEFSVAEYLAASPQLLRRWQGGRGAHPRGVALVAAAVDLRRLGFPGPLPRSLLDATYTRYLDRRDRCEPLDQAWQWALDPAGLPTALLEPASGATDPIELVTVFDYLIDHTKTTAPTGQHPHEDLARTALDHAGPTDLASIGAYAQNHGRYSLAEHAYRKALHLHTQTLGDRHAATLTTQNNLATVLTDRGQLRHAAEEFRAVLGIRRETLGDRHPITITIRHNLARVLRFQGELNRAESEFRAVLALRQEILGDRHADTLTTRHNLASVLGDRGQLDQAEDEFRSVLALRREIRGDRHPATLTTRHGLATVLSDRGQLGQAEEEFQAVLATRREMLGDRHPATLTTRNSLASVLRLQGQLNCAEDEFLTVLAVRREILGEQHPATLLTRHGLASVLQDRGELNQAETEYRAVLATQREILGDQHPATRATRNNLTALLQNRGNP